LIVFVKPRAWWLNPGADLAAARAARSKDFENEKNDLLNNVNP
jgi:hypothetical protein